MPKYTPAQLSNGWTVHRDGVDMLLLSEPLTEGEAMAFCDLLNAEFCALTSPAATDGFVRVPKEPPFEARQFLEGKVGVDWLEGWADMVKRFAAAPQSGKKEDGRELDAPCRWCGYNGAGYWQAGTHNPACPWYKFAGIEARTRYLPAVPPAPSPPASKAEGE